VDDVMEKLPELFNMRELMAKVEERTPYVIVCFQVGIMIGVFDAKVMLTKNLKYLLSKTLLSTLFVKECERMNLLVAEMRRTLKELDLGLKGELTITSDMEDLSDSLFFDQAIHLCFLFGE
jgi:dynein heavy chain